MGVKRTDMTKVDPGSIGLTLLHPVVAGKGQLADREHRDWLEFLIGPGPGLRFEKEVDRLLNDIGHGHVGIRIIKGFTQRTDFRAFPVDSLCGPSASPRPASSAH